MVEKSVMKKNKLVKKKLTQDKFLIEDLRKQIKLLEVSNFDLQFSIDNLSHEVVYLRCREEGNEVPLQKLDIITKVRIVFRNIQRKFW